MKTSLGMVDRQLDFSSDLGTKLNTIYIEQLVFPTEIK